MATNDTPQKSSPVADAKANGAVEKPMIPSTE
jgi:hypothetical protein